MPIENANSFLGCALLRAVYPCTHRERLLDREVRAANLRYIPVPTGNAHA